MITTNKLRRKARHFQVFTGLSVSEFDQVLAQMAPLYEAAQQRTRQRPDRKRRAGAGHPFNLALPERLLMTLMYLRLYVGQSLLGYLFDLDQSNVSRELNERLLPGLLLVLPVPLRDAPLRFMSSETSEDAELTPPTSGKKKRRINTLGELLRAYPDLAEVLVDATEQSIPQPTDKHKRKLAYSGKQHDHTLKTQIVATKELILHVFGGLPGCLHDTLVLGASGVLRQVQKDVKVRLDKGYEGTDTRYPTLSVQQPIKKKRGHLLTAFGRAYNHLLSVLRMPVEHHFARLQKFHILADLYRGRWQRHEDLFCIVSGLLNFKATGAFSLG